MAQISLVDWLRQASEEQLVALLQLRPDVATPPPANMQVLAARVEGRSSIARACEELDALCLSTLEALAALNADDHGVTLESLATLLGLSQHATREPLEKLQIRGLVWGSDDELRVSGNARASLPTFPAGLGKASVSLTQAEAAQALTELDEAEKHLVTTLSGSSPIGHTKQALQQKNSPVQRLLQRGLLLRRDMETVELPRQLALAVRGDSPMPGVQAKEPALTTRETTPSTLDSTAAGEALELLRHAEALLFLWQEEAPDVLRSGGLGVRDIRRTAKALDVDENRVGMLAELAVAADLVTEAGPPTDEPQWIPTTQADSWLTSPAELQWSTLAAAWLALPRLPSKIGTRDAKDKLIAPLSDDLRHPGAVKQRRRVLNLLTELPEGHGITDTEELAAVLAWRAPRQGGLLRHEQVGWTLAEAQDLGITALGGLSSPARALLAAGTTEAAHRMGEVLPEPLSEVLIQADLTLVAPGRLQPDLAGELRILADVESSGAATVYRLAPHTIRRALDAGRSATELHTFFRERSRTPVPQSLTYLIDDAARKHGQLRAGAAGAFLRCEDPVVLDEILARDTRRIWMLRRIAPTVLVSELTVAELLQELRTAGLSPVAEGPDGQVVDVRPRGRRAPAPGRARAEPVLESQPTAEQCADVVRRIRAGERER